MPFEDRRLVAVVCDLGPEVGIGHLMRCLALAEELAARGLDVLFLADVDAVPFTRDQLEARGFAHEAVGPGDPVPALLASLRKHAPEVVVIDSYRLPAHLYRSVAAEHLTLALVDGDPGDRLADVYVDQNIGAEHDRWVLPVGSQRLAGLDYALIRSDVVALRPDAAVHDQADPLRVLAVFGGTDAHHAGPVLTRTLVNTGRPFDLTVVATSAWPEPVEPGPGQRIELIGATDRLAEHVAAADVVVSAAGTSSWELLCLGAACGLVCVADNQWESYQRVVTSGAVVGLGRLEELRAQPSAARNLLSGLLATGPQGVAGRAGLREAGWQMVDGRGRARVADVVLLEAAARAARGPG